MIDSPLWRHQVLVLCGKFDVGTVRCIRDSSPLQTLTCQPEEARSPVRQSAPWRLLRQGIVRSFFLLAESVPAGFGPSATPRSLMACRRLRGGGDLQDLAQALEQGQTFCPHDPQMEALRQARLLKEVPNSEVPWENVERLSPQQINDCLSALLLLLEKTPWNPELLLATLNAASVKGGETGLPLQAKIRVRLARLATAGQDWEGIAHLLDGLVVQNCGPEELSLLVELLDISREKLTARPGMPCPRAGFQLDKFERRLGSLGLLNLVGNPLRCPPDADRITCPRCGLGVRQLHYPHDIEGEIRGGAVCLDCRRAIGHRARDF